VAGQIGQSNADNPTFQPVLYDPEAAVGSRFSVAGLPNSTIARMYHSTATLVPDGRIMIAGSNPNNDVTTVKYPTEYRVEWLPPAYMTRPRPSYTGLPATIAFGATFILTATFPSGTTDRKLALMDLGFATHGVHMDTRLVYLSFTRIGNILTVTAPPNGGVYPPGPGYLFLVANGVPSLAKKTLVGGGVAPPVNLGALENLRSTTRNRLSDAVTRPADGEGAAITASAT